MPKIQWTNLPRPLRDHLFDRLRDRQITVEDLYELKLWRESDPDAPAGPWFKDSGSQRLAQSANIAVLKSVSGVHLCPGWRLL